jgi:ketosteroid isomerase-like protein
MKKRILIFSMITLMACQEHVTTEVIALNSVSVQQGKALFDAFNRHDWKAMSELYSEDAIFLDPSLGMAEVAQSRDSIASKYLVLENFMPDIFDSLVFLGPCDTNKILVEFVSKGTLPDGTAFRLPIMSLLTFKNGLIVSDHTYYDNSGGE